jgi:DNA-binding NarL/FixJ family response regulator
LQVRQSAARWQHPEIGAAEEGGFRLLSTPTRVIIAEDHRLVAELCKSLLAKDYEVSIVEDGHALISFATTSRPDVAIVDINLPMLNGLDAGQRLKKQIPDLKLIYLTVDSDPDIVAEAFRRGASAYLLKTCTVSELGAAIGAALRGELYVSKGVPKEATRYPALVSTGRKMETPLTERQVEVLQLLAEGRAMKEVAGILKMSSRTVAFHKYRIMQELGIKTSAELVRYAIRNHMVA